MNGYAPEFIRGRIEWRADKHRLPSAFTGYWEDAPEGLRSRLPLSVVEPVVYSIAAGGDATVIGTEEVAIIAGEGLVRFSLDEISDISSPNIEERKAKLDFDSVSVRTSTKTHRLPTETGKACFAVWSILLMLSRMQRG